jgi:DNA-binding transcriptional ArsR family regulator
MPEPHAADDAGRYAYEGLDRVLHEKARLGILTALVARPEGLLFGELKQLCTLTDGNLNRHLDVLHQAGLVEIRKDCGQGRPQTTCRLAALGRRRFREYLAQLEQVIHDALAEEPAAPARRKAGLSPA